MNTREWIDGKRNKGNKFMRKNSVAINKLKNYMNKYGKFSVCKRQLLVPNKLAINKAEMFKKNKVRMVIFGMQK